MIRTYSEMIELPTFSERFNYLKLNGQVGSDTFGFDRYLNQALYNSYEWKYIRNEIIIRDNGCDLGIKDLLIPGKIIIHHMNPINIEDIEKRNSEILNPEYLICVSHKTHNALHYGINEVMPLTSIERTKHDTCPWR